MITNEKELENYIMDNEDSFCSFLCELFDLEDVSILDNQVHVGTSNIIDIMCAGLTKGSEPKEKIIIVELKFHAIEAKDFSQLGRYMSAISVVLEEDDENIYGVLVGTGVSQDCGCILNGELLNDRIKVVACASKLEYVNCSDIWWRNCVNTDGSISSCILERTNKGIKNEK